MRGGKLPISGHPKKWGRGNAMHVTMVHVNVKPERVDDFIDACRANHVGSIEEYGNRRFDILQNAGEPTKFVLFEAYTTAEQAVAHKETDHYKTWRDVVEEMMAEPRVGVPFNGLFPVD
jgi:(4S)-4-hydroxy-5-phosphonooxypentane-2,3-dione isomerase